MPSPRVDLRADVNRDGEVSLEGVEDDEGEERWEARRGAIFLANLDDDAQRCPRGERGESDALLATCHDAADAQVNGEADLRDLARLRLRGWAAAPAGARALLRASHPERIRLFLRAPGAATLPVLLEQEALPEPALREGAELFLEGRDLVRDRAVWDGEVALRLEVRDAAGGLLGDDVVRLRTAPLVFPSPIAPAQTVFVSRVEGNAGSEAFRTGLRAAVEGSGARPRLEELPTGDQWAQDFFELGYASLPAPGGPHVMRLALRAASYLHPASSTYPLRRAGRLVFTHLRGPDFGGVQQYDPATPQRMQGLNAQGNTELIPPYVHGPARYPLGRLLVGRTAAFHPDLSYLALLEAQGVQPPVYVDTSWLLIAHVDETLAFIPADTPRGWRVLAADPALARRMLQELAARGFGAARLFVGRSWLTREGLELPAERSVSDVLADEDIMADSAYASLLIEEQLAVLRRETGLTDAEVVRAPFLHHPVDGASIAYQPGTVNGLLIDARTWAAPDPHGPVVEGRDVFKVQLEETLGAVGLDVRWVENWDLYHRQSGEVHCGTNVSRELTTPAWWEALP